MDLRQIESCFSIKKFIRCQIWTLIPKLFIEILIAYGSNSLMLIMTNPWKKYTVWLKICENNLYPMWLSPSGQVAHATLDWRLRRTGIFTFPSAFLFSIPNSSLHIRSAHVLILIPSFPISDTFSCSSIEKSYWSP